MSDFEEDNDSTNPPLYGFVDKTKLINNKPNSITIKMIMDRNLKKTEKPIYPELNKIKEESDEEEDRNDDYADVAELKANKLLKLTHVHLDREKIGEIDNLAEYLGDVTHLYLQHNLIKEIDNLEFLNKLKFICLSHNQISKVENIKMLQNLRMLDLSNNLIEDIPHPKELPKYLVSLDLRENQCVKSNNWPDQCTQIKCHLTDLNQLNGGFLNRMAESMSTASFSNENEDEVNVNDEESFAKMREMIVERSKLRQKRDVVLMEDLSKERRARLDEARRSITHNFK